MEVCLLTDGGCRGIFADWAILKEDVRMSQCGKHRDCETESYADFLSTFVRFGLGSAMSISTETLFKFNLSQSLQIYKST